MKRFTLMIKFTATKQNHVEFKEELLKLFANIEGKENLCVQVCIKTYNSQKSVWCMRSEGKLHFKKDQLF